MSTFNQGVPGVATLINSSAVILSGNAASANALTVRQFGGGNVFSAQTTTGSTALFVGDGGLVGIGTADPKGPIHSYTGRLGYPDSSGSGTSNVMARIQSGSICLDFGSIGGTNPFWIQNHLNTAWNTTYPILLNPNGGNVGIGTTNPDQVLTISAPSATTTAVICKLVNAFTSNAAYINFTNSADNRSAFMGQDGQGLFAYATGALAMGTNTDVPIIFAPNYNSGGEKMRITGAGRVGIGTASPGYQLDVSSFGVDGGTIRIASSSSCQFRMMEVNDTYGFSFTNVAASRMSIKRHSGLQAGTEIISIMRDNQYVGIGTTSPVAGLHCWSTTNASLTTNGSPGSGVVIGSDATNGPPGDLSPVLHFRQSWYTQGQGSVTTGGIAGYKTAASGSFGGGLAFLYCGNGAASLTQGMTLTDAGRVGIGATNPPDVLTVAATFAPTFGVYRTNFSDWTFRVKLASGSVTTANDALDSMVIVGTGSSTNRSISARGTINASGTDYAEYMTKANDFTIKKGDVVGVNSQGLLTNVFAESVSFVVKSTDPSYVGGDVWADSFAEIKPKEVKEDDPGYADYQTALTQFNAKLEEARARVDRIAFAGQVPVNVLGATPGQYIVPVANEDGSIGGQAVSSPTFEQYMSAVGKVIKVLPDGRAQIIVKVV